MKKKNFKKLIPPLAALGAIIAQEFFNVQIAEDQFVAVLNVALIILVAIGIVSNPDN